MRKLTNHVERIHGNCNVMGGTIKIDDVEALHVSFQLTAPINETVVISLANNVRQLARSLGMWQ